VLRIMGHGLSPALLAANERLLALRVSVNSKQWAANSDLTSTTHRLPFTDNCPPFTDLPAHLGWESEAITAVLRRRLAQPQGDQKWLAGLTKTAVADPLSPATNRQSPISTPQSPLWVKLYPDIGLGMLRQEQAAAGRIWLLLRALDTDGRGWVAVAAARAALTAKGSPLRVCGWRQLRNLLRQGQDVFWQRDQSCIWLRSVARVAAALAVTRLAGRPVALPVGELLGGIGTVRAHLYASFHGGRGPEATCGERHKPIARATLSRLSGIAPESQRTYERRVGVRIRANFAIAERATLARQHERAWQQGPALFKLRDFGGHQGAKGESYLAWQLPNSYVSDYRQRPRGQQKRINRRLEDLLMKGMAGNDKLAPQKRYYGDGAAAGKAYGRQPGHLIYWQRLELRSRAGIIWQVLGR
jgi:hypothetical protein